MDGTSNNKDHVFWGAILEDVVRDAPAMYADGIVMPAGANRPSPRKISNELFQQVRDKYTGLEKIQLASLVLLIKLVLSGLFGEIGRRSLDTGCMKVYTPNSGATSSQKRSFKRTMTYTCKSLIV